MLELDTSKKKYYTVKSLLIPMNSLLICHDFRILFIYTTFWNFINFFDFLQANLFLRIYLRL